MKNHTCSNCQTEMQVQEAVEGGGDVVERLVCRACGREFYLGKFKFLPQMRQSDTDATQAKLFHCSTCNIRTAGIVLDVQSECRWCPICQAPLFQYPDCSKERLERKGKLCLTCNALQVVKASKPEINRRTTNVPRGVAWS